MDRYMSAQEAAAALGVSVTTVYAYVSRGMIRSEAAGGDPRKRRYYREDVEQLKLRQVQRRHPETAVETALHWGTPLLDSSLTLIAEGRLFYRGLDAIELAQTHRIEDVAALLWRGDLNAAIAGLRAESGLTLSRRCEVLWPSLSDVLPFERMQILLPLAALDDSAAYDLAPVSFMESGARILHFLAGAATHDLNGVGVVARGLQQAWSPDQKDAEHLLDMALVLCADHELNVSSFTARCAASAGSTAYAVVSAGLAALQGVRHGGSTERVAAMLREIEEADEVRDALVNRLRRGDALPGFGHRLYPDGDPRARLLLDTLAADYPHTDAIGLAREIVSQVHDLTGELPNIDFALVVMARLLRLPPGAPLALFALGRTVGWVGHALEQIATEQLIRPRARYVGVQPDL